MADSTAAPGSVPPMQYWSGQCDSSWVQRNLDAQASADYVQAACGPQPRRDLPAQRAILSAASRDTCMSPKYARRGNTTFEPFDASTEAESTLNQNCRFLQPACDPSSTNYVGKTYRQMIQPNGLGFTTDPQRQAAVDAVDEMSPNELMQQYYGLDPKDQSYPAPSMDSIRSKLKAQLMLDGKTVPYSANQFLEWRSNTCISNPMAIYFRQWCTVPRSRKSGHNSVDGSEVPPFSWDPNWCQSRNHDTGEFINSDDLSSSCGTWPTFCRVNQPYCHAYGHEYLDGNCEENVVQQFLGMIFGSFIVNNIFRYGFLVYDKVKAWTQGAVSSIDSWEASVMNHCSGSLGCSFVASGAVLVGTIAEAGLYIVQEMSNAMNYIPEYYAVNQLSQFFHTGNAGSLFNGLVQLPFGIFPGINAVTAGAAEFLGHIAHFFSDPRLKKQVKVAIPDFFAPGVHLYRYTWKAVATRKYKLAGSAYGVLTTNLVQGGYGHLVATDQHGYEYVELSRVIDEIDARDFSDGQGVDPAYMRLSLLLEDQSVLERMV